MNDNGGEWVESMGVARKIIGIKVYYLIKFLAATLHIAFTETLILLFICILGKLSLPRDLASASTNKFLSHAHILHIKLRLT